MLRWRWFKWLTPPSSCKAIDNPAKWRISTAYSCGKTKHSSNGRTSGQNNWALAGRAYENQNSRFTIRSCTDEIEFECTQTKSIQSTRSPGFERTSLVPQYEYQHSCSNGAIPTSHRRSERKICEETKTYRQWSKAPRY